ncbi:MAG: hypothetical protein ABW328_00450 [Ilumatobacteraceae bacterium]
MSEPTYSPTDGAGLGRLLQVAGFLAVFAGFGVLLYAVLSSAIDVSEMVGGGSTSGLPLVALGTVVLGAGGIVAAVGTTMVKSTRRPRRRSFGYLDFDDDDW